MGALMIEVNKITKKYGSRFAVEDLSFSVQKGEVVGFLGPNGAGKTTTMKIITGYMIPTSGSVTIEGMDIIDDPIGIKRKIGYLPEVPPLYADMYVKDYLSYVAGLKNCPKDQISSLVDAVVEKTGLRSVKNRLIGNISKGYKQRAGLAQALVSDPEILILDEPTVGLDPSQVIEIRNLISQLKGRHTIILSTHILSEVQGSCDRIIIIKEGRMVAQESLDSLKQTQLKGSRKLTIRVKNKDKTLIESLKKLDGVRELGDFQGTQFTVVANTQAGDDFNENVAKEVIASGAGLVELSESFNLEDIFLQLIGKEENKQCISF